MGSGSRSDAIDDADLHAFVDGRIRDDRRKALLRALATSPGERARVDAWQGQNELLRTTFLSVEQEALPALLDLCAKARLQCIPANDAPLVEPSPSNETKSARRIHIAALTATIFVIAIGLGGSWLLFDGSRLEVNSPAAAAFIKPPALEVGISRLPTTHIPDLSTSGFDFVGADAINASTIRFRYSTDTETIAISASNAISPNANDVSALVRYGDGYSWRERGTVFLLTGTLSPEKLRLLANSLQKTK